MQMKRSKRCTPADCQTVFTQDSTEQQMKQSRVEQNEAGLRTQSNAPKQTTSEETQGENDLRFAQV